MAPTEVRVARPERMSQKNKNTLWLYRPPPTKSSTRDINTSRIIHINIVFAKLQVTWQHYELVRCRIFCAVLTMLNRILLIE